MKNVQMSIILGTGGASWGTGGAIWRRWCEQNVKQNAKVPWIKWIKWVFPLIIGWFILGGIFVAYAQISGYGPF